jgi:hypothetical protein
MKKSTLKKHIQFLEKMHFSKFGLSDAAKLYNERRKKEKELEKNLIKNLEARAAQIQMNEYLKNNQPQQQVVYPDNNNISYADRFHGKQPKFGQNRLKELYQKHKKKIKLGSKVALSTLAVIGTATVIHKRNKKAKELEQTKVEAPNSVNENSKDVLIYIYGLGKCDNGNVDPEFNIKFYYKDKHQIFNENINEYNKLYNKVYVKCDPKQLRIINDIQKFCLNKPSNDNIFVQSIYNKIDTLLKEGKNVTVIGHSYGGSVSSRLAIMLNNNPNRNNLHIATTGSIYLIKKDQVPNIDFVQYMMPDDFALGCTKIESYKFKKDERYHNDKGNNITWIPVPIDIKSPKLELYRWTVHKSYEKFTDQLIKNKSIHL